MDFDFQTVPFDGSTFLQSALPALPKCTAVYRIFDLHGQLIVLDKTSNLAQRMERFFGPHSERVKDLDLRQIASRIEYVRTCSPFETTYALYIERRRHFPKSYRRMKTFRYFTLMKINRKQRFPRVYASRQIKTGVEYYGPFVSRAQFARMKTAVERTFKLRPCLFNIRGNDPHPDCMYFQMHTCSRPCNSDIGRSAYLADVRDAALFIQGHDAAIEQPWMTEMTSLADEMKFEEAEALRKQIERLRRARQDMKDSFLALSAFNYVVVLPSETSASWKIALVCGGAIVSFREYTAADLRQTLGPDLEQLMGTAPVHNHQWHFDEFCLVCNFLVKPLQSVQLIPFSGVDNAIAAVEKLGRGKRKKGEAQLPS